MNDVDGAAKDLAAPAGAGSHGREGIITNRTDRRQEMLERLAEDPHDPGYTPPGQVLGDDRNEQAYEEQLAHDKGEER